MAYNHVVTTHESWHKYRFSYEEDKFKNPILAKLIINNKRIDCPIGVGRLEISYRNSDVNKCYFKAPNFFFQKFCDCTFDNPNDTTIKEYINTTLSYEAKIYRGTHLTETEKNDYIVNAKHLRDCQNSVKSYFLQAAAIMVGINPKKLSDPKTYRDNRVLEYYKQNFAHFLDTKQGGYIFEAARLGMSLNVDYMINELKTELYNKKIEKINQEIYYYQVIKDIKKVNELTRQLNTVKSLGLDQEFGGLVDIKKSKQYKLLENINDNSLIVDTAHHIYLKSKNNYLITDNYLNTLLDALKVDAPFSGNPTLKQQFLNLNAKVSDPQTENVDETGHYYTLQTCCQNVIRNAIRINDNSKSKK